MVRGRRLSRWAEGAALLLATALVMCKQREPVYQKPFIATFCIKSSPVQEVCIRMNYLPEDLYPPNGKLLVYLFYDNVPAIPCTEEKLEDATYSKHKVTVYHSQSSPTLPEQNILFCSVKQKAVEDKLLKDIKAVLLGDPTKPTSKWVFPHYMPPRP